MHLNLNHRLSFIAFLFVILSFLGCISLVSSNKTLGYAHELALGPDVILKWTDTNQDATWVTMEMTASTTGYVAIGFSPTGGMKGSDIVMGWVDELGVGHIKDLYAIGESPPIEDPEQNYELLQATEVGNVTKIVFRRKWDTCDKEHDFVIGEDTIRIIWAHNAQDPFTFDGQFTSLYHGTDRGVRKTYLKIAPVHFEFPDNGIESANSADSKYTNVKYWDIRMENNTVNAEDDVYFCSIAKFPELDKKHHMMGFRPLLQDSNKYRIHHIIMYECVVPADDGGTKSIFEQHVNVPTGRCYTPNMPPEWGKYCVNIPILWTSGSEGTMFPRQVGFPLGEEHGGSTYFMFEIHYDNPSRQTFVDNSGVRLFYTDQLREFDGGVIAVGHKISPFETVPHGMPSFTAIGYCPSECTKQTIPETGIKTFTVLLHSHYNGRKLALKHIRNGEELAPLAKDDHYDYNYQQARPIGQPVTILPGDELMTVCEYDTSDKTAPSFGGLGTRDEMCMSFVYYYPKSPLDECKTQPEFYSYLNGLGVTTVGGNILSEINMPYTPVEHQLVEYPDNPFSLKNSTYDRPLNALDALHIIDGHPNAKKYSTVGDLIRNMNWSDSSVGPLVEQKWLNGQHYAFCTGDQKKRFPLENYKVFLPKDYRKYVEVDKSSCPAPAAVVA